MKTYIIKRLIQAVGVCLVISMISFFLLFLNTDPALVGQALPLYWFGIMLIIIFGFWLVVEVNQKILDSYTMAREVIRT